MILAGGFPWPAGFTVSRLLAQGPGGVVALAEDRDGVWTVLKLLRLIEGRDADAALLRHRSLLELTAQPGLLPMLGCGLTKDRLWLWESLRPVDDVSGGLLEEAVSYHPENLRELLIRDGPMAVVKVAGIGRQVLTGLAVLHGAGLVHRDVKPANFFVLGGRVVLGDYGLVAPPGEPFDFSGTEGFVPPEGGADQPADLFALGKALYELWTGNDRLEFPSIPRKLTDAADWKDGASLLNEVLLRACSGRSVERYVEVDQFDADLASVVAGRPITTSRRNFVRGAVVGAVGIGLAGWWISRFQNPAPVAVWKRVKAWDHIPAFWGPRSLVPDPARNRLLKLHCDGVECAFHEISLTTWEVRSTVLKPPVNRFEEAVVHPDEGSLWMAEAGRGPVWRFDDAKLAFSEVGGGGPASSEDFRNSAYWNPVTKRMGCIGGYGGFKVHARRWEFDGMTNRWVEQEAKGGSVPWPRQVPWLMAEPETKRLHVFGGIGNSTGKQGSRDTGLKFFNSQFHFLGDLWTLDLGTSLWTQRAPVTALELDRDHSVAFLAGKRSVIVVHSVARTAPVGTAPDVHCFRLDGDAGLASVLSRGDIPEGRASGFLTPGESKNALVAFYQDGIYTLTIEG